MVTRASNLQRASGPRRDLRSGTFALALGLAWAGIGCASDELPPVQVEGELLSYAADEPVCAGTVEYGERWMKALAGRLGIAEDELLHTTYYQLSLDDAQARCGAQGCVRASDGIMNVYDGTLLDKHELVHAIHLSAWPKRRRVLHEGLAAVFDDGNVGSFVWQGGVDVDAEIEADHVDTNTYLVGATIVYWTLERHGIDAFREFWYADAESGGAEDFRALYQQHFGESLDAMLAEVEGQPACPFLTCVGDLVDWQADRWTTSSPTGCDDGLVRGVEDELERSVLLDIPSSGTYVISVSASPLGAQQGAFVQSCADACTVGATSGYYAGQSREVMLEAGLHRVTTGKLGVDDPGVEVEIRPL